MSYRFTPFDYLLHEKPELAREKMLDAMVEAQGNTAKAWKNAGISHFSWYRYLKLLGIKNEMAELRRTLHAPKLPYDAVALVDGEAAWTSDVG